MQEEAQTRSMAAKGVSVGNGNKKRVFLCVADARSEC